MFKEWWTTSRGTTKVSPSLRQNDFIIEHTTNAHPLASLFHNGFQTFTSMELSKFRVDLENLQWHLQMTRRCPVISVGTRGRRCKQHTFFRVFQGVPFKKFFEIDSICFSTDFKLFRCSKNVITKLIFEFCHWHIENIILDASFLNRFILLDECFFHEDKKVNKHSVRIWGSENPHERRELSGISAK